MVINKIKSFYYELLSYKIVKNLSLDYININMFEMDILKYVYNCLIDYNFKKDINNFNYLKNKNLTLYEFLNISYEYQLNIYSNSFNELIHIPKIKFKDNFYGEVYENYLVDLFKEPYLYKILSSNNILLLNKIMSKLLDKILENIKNRKIEEIYIYGKLKG